jgi:hypothetical protein
MPYVIACPSCGAKLKSTQRLPVGCRCACPQCREAFTLSDPGEEIREPVSSAPVPPPLPLRAPAAAEVPEAILVDETDREVEPPPRSPRRDRHDEDHEDERPRRRRTQPKKQGRGPLIALLAGVAALILFCGGGAVLVYFADPFDWRGGGASSDMLAWAPADTQSITYLDVEAARKSDELRNDLALVGDSNRFGIRPDEISEVVGANRDAAGLLGMRGEPEVLVIRLNRNADRKAILAATGGREATAAGRKYYQTNMGGGLYFASDRLVVITPTEATLTGLLQKEEGKVVVSEDLRAALKRATGTVAVANVGQAAETTDVLGMMSVTAVHFGPGGPGIPMALGPRPKARTTLYSIKASGRKGTMRFESTYDSSDSARRVADDLKRNLGQNRGSMFDVDSYDISRSGSTVTLTIDGVIRKRNGFMPFGM